VSLRRAGCWVQFLKVVSALHTAACQLSPILGGAEAEAQAGSCEGAQGGGAGSECGGQGPVKSPLVRKLLAEAASPAVRQLSASMLSVVDRQAASSGDKANLIVCSHGRFPEVNPPLTLPLAPPFCLRSPALSGWQSLPQPLSPASDTHSLPQPLSPCARHPLSAPDSAMGGTPPVVFSS